MFNFFLPLVGFFFLKGRTIIPFLSGIEFDPLDGYIVQDIEYYHDYIIDGIIIYIDKTTGKKGFMTIDGDKLTEPIYLFVSHFENGIAKVHLGNDRRKLKIGYINTKGEYIWEPTR